MKLSQDQIVALAIIIVLALVFIALIWGSTKKTATRDDKPIPSPIPPPATEEAADEEEACQCCCRFPSDCREVVARVMRLCHCRGMDPGVYTFGWMRRHIEKLARDLELDQSFLEDALDHEAGVCATEIATARERREVALRADDGEQQAA